MSIATHRGGAEPGQHVEQVYDGHHARLRHYFLRQIGDRSEAEACVQETFGRFFLFIKRRQWEQEAPYIPVYLMRIAGLLCLEKLTEKGPLRAESLDEPARDAASGWTRDEAIRSIRKRLQSD